MTATTTTTAVPSWLRRGPLFWSAMNHIKVDGRLGQIAAPAVGPYRRWHQLSFRVLIGVGACGTALCLAGYVCDLTGGRWLLTEGSNGQRLIDGEVMHLGGTYPSHYLLADPDDAPIHVETHTYGDKEFRVVTAEYRAARLLGLGVDGVTDHGDLFAGHNTYERLEEIGTKVFGPRPVAV